ncbi:MAG: O-antigen ligase family protein, partial [Verrucomicrobiota bacterium]
VFIAVLGLVGLKIGKWKTSLRKESTFAFLLPIVWLIWQWISAARSVEPGISRATVNHFTACVSCFFLGWFCLSHAQNFRPVILGIVAGLVLIILVGWNQHFGGMEETRRFFYAQPNWREYPSEFLQKIASNRIYSTLFYPNTLAAAILLFFPVALYGLWILSSRAAIAVRYGILGVISFGALGCLIWSGSKSGWLLALFLSFLGLLQIVFNPRLKKGLVIGLLVIGFGGFALKYAIFFQRGATSVVARFDYWRASIEITKRNPLFGTGPGTFAIPYQKVKASGAEMARLCHNDYLEQASDSGVLGLLTYTAFVFGSIWLLRPRGFKEPFLFAVWLGVTGNSLHSLVEFNLYIPALAWPTFLFLGFLWCIRVEETHRQPTDRSLVS